MPPPVKLSDREKKLAMATFAVFVFYIFYSFFLTPKWDEIVKVSKSVREARLELKVAEGKVKILESIQKGALEQPAISKVPKEERALAVLRALAQATTKSKLKLVSIRPIISEKKEEFKFDLTAMGSYQNLYEFLRILGDLDVIVMADSLRISGGGSKRPELHMKIVLTAYF